MSYIGNTPTQQSFTGGMDQFNGNASNTVFGLSRTISTVYDINVYVEGVYQRPDVGYTVSANTITFTSAPSAGANNVTVVYENFTATSIVPQQGSVTHTAFAANAIPTALGYVPANKAGDTFSGAVSGITTLAAGNTTITGSLTASANVNLDAGTFFVDGTNNRVGINNTAPTSALTVTGNAAFSNTVAIGGDFITPHTGFKNRIINGAMVISQRLGTSSSNISSDSYTMDRWLNRVSGGGVITNQQTTSVVPTNFSYALALTVQTADASIAAGDVYELEQRIEGFNTQDLAWGTASASPVTLSFWVRSSVTGTYGVGIQSSSYGRSYVTTYSIGSANTWTYITLTIPGDTGATQNNGNGIGVGVNFDLGSGTSSNTTAGSWGTGGSYWRTSSCVNWIANSGATFYITGVQLEKGSTATSFDYRPYGTEFALCQRYYYNSYPANSSGTGHTFAGGVIPSAASIAECCVGFPVTMRAAPTVTFPNGLGQSGVAVAAASTASQIDTTGFLRGNKTSGNFTASSSLVTGGFIASSEL